MLSLIIQLLTNEKEELTQLTTKVKQGRVEAMEADLYI